VPARSQLELHELRYRPGRVSVGKRLGPDDVTLVDLGANVNDLRILVWDGHSIGGEEFNPSEARMRFAVRHFRSLDDVRLLFLRFLLFPVSPYADDERC
jgi:hypothetical protein